MGIVRPTPPCNPVLMCGIYCVAGSARNV